jgi:glycine betaine/choline ABC-type transport system substrate-binding protein
MTSGELDLYLEYTGTGLTSVLNLPTQTDPQQVYNTVKQEYDKQFQMSWLEPWGFNDTYALIMTKARADELGIKSLSDLQGKAEQLVLGSDQEFFDRPDGLPGLEKAYNIKFKEERGINSGLMYQAVSEAQVDVIAGFSTDGRIPALNLVVLQDDKLFFPPYFAAPVVRQDTLAKSPEIEQILNKVAGKINDETMARLNLQVDQEQKEPADVAQAFLKEQGLIQ